LKELKLLVSNNEKIWLTIYPLNQIKTLRTMSEHLSSPSVFSGIHGNRSLVLCACFVYRFVFCLFWSLNCIGGVLFSVLASNAIDHGFNPRSGQTKDYKISICCFLAKHAALRSKSKDWLARNQNNVSVWSDMSIRRLLFQCVSTIKIHLSVSV
jgi:hypothetical protein